MAHRYPLKILISLVVVAACAYGCYQRIITVYALPLVLTIADSHSVTVHPLPYHALPPGLQPGDKLDLPSMDAESRYAVMPTHYIANSWGLQRDGNYQLSVYRGPARVTIPVAAVPVPASHLVRYLYRWIDVVTFVLLSGLVLLVLWRGRGRAATGFMLWSLGALCASALMIVEAQALVGTVCVVVSNLCSMLSGIGLYCLVESTVGATFSARARWLWRMVFILVLVAGGLTSQIIGPIVFITLGWSSLVAPSFQILWAASFLIPIVMLFAGYRSVKPEQRLKSRWMMWSGALWAFAVLVVYLQTVGLAIALIAGNFLYLLAMPGFLYAILRHRAVDVSVFFDHTLVYGTVTALVVGILAATNSLVQHAALGTGASLLVQIVVPLALGVVLGQVRKYADIFVERVFFRRKYLADKALRRFARHSEGYDRPEDLLFATTEIIHSRLNTPGVAVYVRKDGDYAIASSAGKREYPASVAGNDSALAAARAGAKDIDLADLHSALGCEGYVFSMGAQAALVCANRPGEHYSSGVRKLLAYVARQVGTSLRDINMRESLNFVRAVARGTLDPTAAREQALKLETGWAES